MPGLYSLRNRDWWDEALALCAIGRDGLPLLSPAGAAAAVAAPSSSLPGLRLFVPAGNDQTAGAYGNGAAPGTLVATLGTALVLYRLAGTAPGPFSARGAWGPYPGGGFYEMACSDEGCARVDQAAQRLFPGSGMAAFDAAASRGQTEALAGECYFMTQEAEAGSAWTLPAPADVQAYAALEGIVFRLRALQESMPDARAQALCVTGGGGAQRLLAAAHRGHHRTSGVSGRG